MTVGFRQVAVFLGIALWTSVVFAEVPPTPVAVSLGFTGEGDVPLAALDHASDVLREEAAAALASDHELLYPADRAGIPAGMSPALTVSGVITALPTGGYRMDVLLEGVGDAAPARTVVTKALAPWVMSAGERALLEKQVRQLAEEVFAKGLGLVPQAPAKPPSPVVDAPVPLPIPGSPVPAPAPLPAPEPDISTEDPTGAATRPATPEEAEAALRMGDEDSSFESFVMGRLYSMRHVKPPTANERVSFGAHLRIAPVKALVKSQVDNLKKEYPEVGQAIEVIEQIDPEEMDRYLDAIGNAGETLDEQARYLEESGLSPEDQQLIRDLTEDGETLEQLRTVIDIVRDPEKAVTFTLEPYATINLDPIAITGTLPLAGFSPSEGDTEFALGNATVDLRMGHHFGAFGAPTFGLSYGVTTNLPTGTQRADSLAFSSLLDAPKYLHAYLGVEPYLVLGLDVPFLLIQAEMSFVDLIAVRDGADGDKMYMKYGAGLSIIPTDFISVTCEIAGSFALENANQFDVHMVTGGLRYAILGVELGIAVQVPIAQPGPEAFGGFGGVSFGSPADFNALLRVDAAF